MCFDIEPVWETCVCFDVRPPSYAKAKKMKSLTVDPMAALGQLRAILHDKGLYEDMKAYFIKAMFHLFNSSKILWQRTKCIA